MRLDILLPVASSRVALAAILLSALAIGAPRAAAQDTLKTLVNTQAEDEEPGVQAPELPSEAPRVFLDCRRCDGAHVRSEVLFVNHVREAGAAQVHILVTDQAASAGGRVYTLEFLGRGRYAGLNQTLTYTASGTATAAQVRDGLTNMIKLGLVPYVASTSLASRLQLRYSAVGGSPSQVTEDRWRNWTFEVYGGGNLTTESTQDAWNARYGFYANRVTERWKVRARPYFNHNSRTIRRDEEEDIRVDQRRHGVESYVVRSVGPRMGVGIFADYVTSTLDNQRHAVTLTPALEYSIFPYSEANRRSVTLTYRVGYELVDYFEETIFEKTDHRVTLNTNLSYRLGGGVSLNIGGSYQRINDQLGLPRGEASFEDVLLQRRRLATAYRASASMGLSYTFGSIFTNVVNPRL